MKQRKLMFVWIILVFLCFCAVFGPVTPNAEVLGASGSSDKYQGPVNDAHCHFVNFLQDSEGALALLEAMDKAGVEQAVIYGLPVAKKWESFDEEPPEYYTDNDSYTYYYGMTDVIVAESILKLSSTQQKRFHPFICGFNPTDRYAIKHIHRMMELYPKNFWHGIGEILTRKGELTPLTIGENARANHVALDPVYEFAGKNDLPVWIHSNIGTVGIEEPIYLYEIEAAVKKHKGTRFVWCHAGYSRYLKIPGLEKHVRRMLETYSNLWVDLSWIVYEEVVAPGGQINPDWLKLIRDFPGRFLIGSDKIGSFIKVKPKKTTYMAEMAKYRPLLDALGPVAPKVAYWNLKSVLPKFAWQK